MTHRSFSFVKKDDDTTIRTGVAHDGALPHKDGAAAGRERRGRVPPPTNPIGYGLRDATAMGEGRFGWVPIQ
jgi:hypothetical protein